MPVGSPPSNLKPSHTRPHPTAGPRVRIITRVSRRRLVWIKDIAMNVDFARTSHFDIIASSAQSCIAVNP